MDKIDELEMEIARLNEQMPSGDSNNGASKEELNSLKTELLQQISALEEVLTNFKNETEAKTSSIEDSLSALTDITIPDLENKIETSSGGGTEENWVTLYDRDSEDEALNWGYPEGIGGGLNVSGDFLPNFLLYKKIKITYVQDSDRTLFVYDISNLAEKKVNNYKVFLPYSRQNQFVSASITIKVKDDGSFLLSFPTVYKLLINNGKSPTVTTQNHPQEYLCFGKIEGLAF